MLFALRRPHYETEFRFPSIKRMVYPSHHVNLEDLIFPTAAMMAFSNMDRCLQARNTQKEAKVEQKNSFEVKVDVQHFRPEELDVKTVDNYIVVTGKHEEKQDDHGYISREFIRRYALPEGVKADAITCNMSSDGVLLISAPLQIENAPENEFKIPISLTGAPAKNSSPNVTTEKAVGEEAVKVEAQEMDANSIDPNNSNI